MEYINNFFTGFVNFLSGLAEIVNRIDWGSIINGLLDKIQ